MNKKGQEVSINVVVGIVLGLIMLGAGLTLFFTILDKSEDTKLQVDEQIKQRILSSMDDGKQIFIPETNVRITKQKSITFIVAVNNIYETPSKFKINAESINSTLLPDTKIVVDTAEREIGAKQKDTFLFAVDNPKELPEGQHGIKVTVEYNDGTGYNQYENTKIVYLTK